VQPDARSRIRAAGYQQTQRRTHRTQALRHAQGTLVTGEFVAAAAAIALLCAGAAESCEVAATAIAPAAKVASKTFPIYPPVIDCRAMIVRPNQHANQPKRCRG
jgi:hypothetical protein